MSARLRSLSGLCARHGFLIATSLFILAPFVWMVSLSVKPPGEFFQPDVRLLPNEFYGLANYGEAFERTPLLRFMINGVLVCATTLVLQLAIAAPAAYALAKLRFRAREALFGLVLICLLIPNQVLAIPIFVMFSHVGMLDTFPALIVPAMVSPFAIFLLRQFFKTVPDDLIHAARLDGLSELSIVWRIMLPSAMPAVIAIALLSIVGRWNDLFWPLILIKDESLMTPPLGILHFRGEEAGSAYGPLMAAAVIVVAPLIVMFLLLQRRFVEGVTMSGLK